MGIRINHAMDNTSPYWYAVFNLDSQEWLGLFNDLPEANRFALAWTRAAKTDDTLAVIEAIAVRRVEWCQPCGASVSTLIEHSGESNDGTSVH